MIFGRRPAVAKAVAGRPTQSRTGVWRIFLFSLKGTKFPVLKRQRSFCLLPSHTDRIFMWNTLTIAQLNYRRGFFAIFFMTRIACPKSAIKFLFMYQYSGF
jgi:hypothetical protein